MNTAEQVNDRLALSAPLSYPTARLRLGIIYVGLIVLVAAGMLTLELEKSVLLRTVETRLGVFTGLGILLGLVALLSLPFDLIGGYLLPRAFGREVPTFFRTMLGMLRGAFNHAGYLWMTGAVYLFAAQLGGCFVVPVVATIFLIQLLVAQTNLARFVGSLSAGNIPPTESPALPLLFIWSKEESFSGGIVGWPGMEQIVVAERWKRNLPPRLYELFVRRRIAAVEMGLRYRGVVIASVWNLLGITGAAWITGFSGTSLAEVISFICLTTLWSFIALLIMPSLTRNAVASVDRQMLASGCSRDDLAELARITGDWQDGENSRAKAVETIFHPLPSTENRIAALDGRASKWAAWNAARMTLYLSWASLGLLSRAVHSNAGRPDLWAMGAVD